MRRLSIIFLFFAIPAYSQQDSLSLRFQSITVDQGLPHNYVHAIAQDKKGFIWIGTNYGLARYDGYNFKVFLPDSKKPFSISQKPVGIVFPDSRGNLWISFNSGGINKMNLETEQFTGYFPNTANKNSIGFEIKYFLEDADSNLWVASNNGIFLYNNLSNSFTYALSKKNFTTATNYINSIADDHSGNLWFVVENKVGILQKKSLNTLSFGAIANNPSLDTIQFSTVYSADNEYVWLTTMYNGLLRYTIKTKTITYLLQPVSNLIKVHTDSVGNLYAVTNLPYFRLFVCKKENLNSNKFTTYVPFGNRNTNQWVEIINDKFGDVWISSVAGLAKFNFKTGLTSYVSSSFVPYSITDPHMEHIFIDRTDNLWICPYRKGINKADLRQKPFTFYFPEVKKIEDIATDKNITSVYEDSKGYIWLGNSKFGITLIHKATGKYYTFRVSNTDQVTSIYEDKNGDFWLGTFWSRLYRVKCPDYAHLRENVLLTFPSITSYDVTGVRKIVADKHNNLWFASIFGLVQWLKDSDKIRNQSLLYDSLNSFSGFYRTVYIDKNEQIWTGSNNGGLSKYDALKHTFTHYLNNARNPKTISNNTVYNMFEDSLGMLWLATGQGLEKFNSRLQLFEHKGLENELYKRSIFNIFTDKVGHLWMASDIGIIRYKPANDHADFFGSSDGIQNNEFNTTSGFKSPSGEIYFAGTGGLISFYPCEFKPNPILAKPVVTNIFVNNKVLSPGDSLHGRVLLQKQVWETNKIALYYYETDFTIEFSALHYSAPAKINYYYKLIGLNTEWIHADAKRRFATYTALPPGTYTFVLKASNNDGLMCLPSDEVHLLITIIPPYWQTAWFRILLLVSVVCSVFYVVRSRVKSLRNKNKILDQRVIERTFELEQVNAFLEERTYELEEANAILEERQEEINLQKEEIQTQYETLATTNHLLENQQSKIIEQNTELDQHRNKLEYLVEIRTRELENALLKAEESDKLKTSFLTNMSHEIRTPMNAILGFSSLLRDESLAENHEEFIGIIESNGKTLLTLINDILELSSIQSLQVSLKPLNNNLFSLLTKIYNTAKIETDHKKLSLQLDTSLIPAHYHIAIDEIRFKQVFSNLIANAIKFTNEGSITFGISEINHMITFYVTDTGIGISNEIGDSVFERFYKIENNTSHLYRGTGLGLAICKSIVSLWNGHIWYSSVPKKGTTFYFTYPSDVEKSATAQTALKTGKSTLNLKGKKLLIAEDEDSNYTLLLNYLRRTNAEIIWAQNGEEAVKFASELNIDLILMDIKMPLMDGIEASKKIKQLKPKIPIIAQTAFAFKNEIDEILSIGINAYIVKPINKDELLELIDKYL